MVVTLGDLEVGAQDCHIQRRGRLADAAAKTFLQAAGNEDTRFAEAARGGALADYIIIGEFIAGVQDGAVDVIARKLYVMRT